jgi:hypothetical protein
MKRKRLLPLAAIPLAMVIPHAAGAAGPRAGVRLDQSTHVAHLTIPDPCKVRGKNVTGTCKWLLWGDEPDIAGRPVIGYVEGRSGTLSLATPRFCGVVQYDALVSGSNNVWHYVALALCGRPPVHDRYLHAAATASTPPLWAWHAPTVNRSRVLAASAIRSRS